MGFPFPPAPSNMPVWRPFGFWAAVRSIKYGPRRPRGQQGTQNPRPADAAGRRFTERAHESSGRLAHSVRGLLSGTVAKRMRLKLVSTQGEDGERRYSVQR